MKTRNYLVALSISVAILANGCKQEAETFISRHEREQRAAAVADSLDRYVEGLVTKGYEYGDEYNSLIKDHGFDSEEITDLKGVMGGHANYLERYIEEHDLTREQIVSLQSVIAYLGQYASGYKDLSGEQIYPERSGFPSK